MPKNLGASERRLAPCPDAPRCVSSDARDESRRVEPFKLAAPAEQAWQTAVEAVQRLPRTRIVTRTGDYLHAEVKSPVFRFVDDLELHLRPEEDLIAVRSAARIGYYDFGVNRRRVENLRERLRAAGVVR